MSTHNLIELRRNESHEADLNKSAIDLITSQWGNEQQSLADTTEKQSSHDTPRPEGFEDFDFDELEAQARINRDMEPLRQNAASQLGFSWIKGGGLYGNVSAFGTALRAKREERLHTKLMHMNIEEQRQFLEKYTVKQERIRKIGMYALAGGMTTAILRPVIEPLMTSLSDNLDGINEVANRTSEINARSESRDLTLVYHDGPMPRPNHINDTLLTTYSNGDVSFYDYANKDFRGDFGPMVQASPEDGIYGIGFADWMGRNKHEPNGLANLVSGLKLDGHSDSLTDRNSLADIFDNDRTAQARADLMVQAELKNTDKFTIETIDIDFRYDTTYMVDANGDPVIATQLNVDHGGTAFMITNKQTGEVTYWRKDCGAYQQIWPIKEAPEVEQPVFVPVEHTPPQRPVLPPVEHTPPPTTNPPVAPPPASPPPVAPPPITPPGGGGNPPPITEEHKGSAYIRDEHAAVRGHYEFRAEPGQVSTEVHSQGQPGVQQEPIVDKHTAQPTAETGGAAPVGSTPGLGSPGVSETSTGGSNADAPKSGTATGPE